MPGGGGVGIPGHAPNGHIAGDDPRKKRKKKKGRGALGRLKDEAMYGLHHTVYPRKVNVTDPIVETQVMGSPIAV